MSDETPKPSFSAYQGDDGEIHIVQSGPQDIITIADVVQTLVEHPEDWHKFDLSKLKDIDPSKLKDAHVFVRREKRADGSVVTPTIVGPNDTILAEEAWQTIMEQVGPIYAAMIQVRATARRERPQES